MSKPEVVAIAFPSEAFEGAEGVGLNDYSSRVGVTCPTELIRLTDHERLQAEAERLQAAHEATLAADKARIAAQQWLLEMCQQSLIEHGESYCELNAYLRGDIDHNEVLAIKGEHDAALARQREGEA